MIYKNKKKLEKLIYILDLPKTYPKEIIEIVIYLSMYGWQGYKIRGKGYIQCLFCRRLVGLWNFASHNHSNNNVKKITEQKNFFDTNRPWHNMNLKRLNEILSKRKAPENIENENKKLKIENEESLENENNEENTIIIDNENSSIENNKETDSNVDNENSSIENNKETDSNVDNENSSIENSKESDSNVNNENSTIENNKESNSGVNNDDNIENKEEKVNIIILKLR